MTAAVRSYDVHHHLWPEPFLATLARRERPPRLRGRALELESEPPLEIDLDLHTLDSRIAQLDRDATKLELALRRGATHAVDAAEEDAVAKVKELSSGGVDHAFEVVGRAETIRFAWDVLRPGATAVVIGLAPRKVEASVPAIEFLSEKSIKGCYYGSGDPAADLADLAVLAASGRFAVADVVSHFTDLDGIEEAFDRLRRGEGARTVAVMDEELAQAKPV